MVAYTIEDVADEVWQRFKDQVPRSMNLNQALIDRIDTEEVSGRSVDGSGFVSIGTEYAGSTVDVYVRELSEGDDDE